MISFTVAVGMIGADPGFVMYQKGVFTSTKGGRCDLGQADHAMLITGYGEEVSKDGTVQKYWIGKSFTPCSSKHSYIKGVLQRDNSLTLKSFI